MSNRRKPVEPEEASVKRSIRYLRVSSKKQMDTDFEVDPEVTRSTRSARSRAPRSARWGS